MMFGSFVLWFGVFRGMGFDFYCTAMAHLFSFFIFLPNKHIDSAQRAVLHSEQ